MAKIYLPNGKLATPQELANHANVVHQQAGGRGNVFSENDFNTSNPSNRLRGDMCSCGVDANGISKGEFSLLPVYDSDVRDGGKAYMICKKCNCFSHL